MGRAIELRKDVIRDADPIPKGEGNTADGVKIASGQLALRSLKPAHAEKQHAREPGDLWNLSI